MSVRNFLIAWIGVAIGPTIVLGASPKNSAGRSKEAVRVVTAFSTPRKSGHPILLLAGEATRLQFPVDQRYSKWTVMFDRPVAVDTVDVLVCAGSKPFSDGVELLLDHSERRFFIDGGRRLAKFKVKSTAQMLTLNFLESSGLCLENIRIQTSPEWLRPRILMTTGDAVISDGALGFGLRTTNGGNESRKAKLNNPVRASVWKLAWENPLIVDGVEFWNGNQQTDETFLAHSRVHAMDLIFDDAIPIRVDLEDRQRSQMVQIKEPHSVRSLELKSVSTYPGRFSRDPILSEVRLLAGGEFWIPVTAAKSTDAIASGESEQATQVREQGFVDILDREMRVTERGDIWKFRFRSDGTFFARVFVDRQRVARAWSVSGTWSVTEPVAAAVAALASGVGEPAPGLALTLSGSKMATAFEADALPCGRFCFQQSGTSDPRKKGESPVLEQIEIQRVGKSFFLLRNRTALEDRAFDFTDLKVRLHSFYD